MFSGIRAQDGIFLAELGHIEDRISKTNQQVTSGIRVAQAIDDPSAVLSILQYQSQIDRLTQVNTNLQRAGTEITTADGALQTASTILDRLNSLASQGLSDNATADTRQKLGIEVQQLQAQLVSIADTSIGDRFIFGGNDANVKPYSSDDPNNPNPAAVYGVVKNLTITDPTYLSDGNGATILSSKNATEIFDLTDSNGNPAPGNVFKSVYDLSQALLNPSNNDADTQRIAIQTALGDVKNAAAHLGAVTVFYGNVENWIQQSNQITADQITAVSQTLGSLQEVDMPTAVTQLTANQTALQVSLSAHASLSPKTLFDYLG